MEAILIITMLIAAVSIVLLPIIHLAKVRKAPLGNPAELEHEMLQDLGK